VITHFSAARWLSALTVVIGTAVGTLARADEPEPDGPIISLPGHTGAVMCIAFSPDGRYAATHGGLGDHTFHLWDIGKRKRLQAWPHQECSGASALWTPDSRWVLSGGGGGAGSGAVVLQDPRTGVRVGQLVTREQPVRSVALSPDGKRAADAGGFVRVSDFKTGDTLNNFESGTGINAVAFSPDGRFLVTGGDDHHVRSWDLDLDRQERLFEGHTGVVGCVAFSGDGREAWSASYSPLGDSDGTIRLWSAQSGEETSKLEVGGEGGDLLTAVAFSPHTRRALTGHSNGEVHLWDLDAKNQLASYGKHQHPIQSVAFSADGRLALSGENCQGGSAMWLYRLPAPPDEKPR
jgi:WD40 repeat protein